MANADGTPALIEVLLTHHLLHEHLMTGPAAAPRTGASTADAIAPEARRPGGPEARKPGSPEAAGTGAEPEEVLPSAASGSRAGIAPPPAAVRDGQPHDKHPLPPAHYDQLPRLRRPDRPTPFALCSRQEHPESDLGSVVQDLRPGPQPLCGPWGRARPQGGPFVLPKPLRAVP